MGMLARAADGHEAVIVVTEAIPGIGRRCGYSRPPPRLDSSSWPNSAAVEEDDTDGVGNALDAITDHLAQGSSRHAHHRQSPNRRFGVALRAAGSSPHCSRYVR
jgi:hypothetical protein